MKSFASAALAAVLALAGAAAAHETQFHSHDAPVAAIYPFAYTTAASAKAGGVYIPLENRGPADRLVGARSEAAARVEIHETQEEGGVMRMRRVEAGLPLPEGGTVEMKPGGVHVMLMGLKAPLVAGGTLAVTLIFESGLELEVEAPVIERGADAPAGGCPHGDGPSHD